MKVQTYYEKNKEELKRKNKEWYNTPKGRWTQLAHAYRVKDKKKFGTDEGSVTTEQLQNMYEQQPFCTFCGEKDYHKLGLDRIDNNKPHTVDNCHICCTKCNNERNRLDYEKFTSINKKRFEMLKKEKDLKLDYFNDFIKDIKFEF